MSEAKKIVFVVDTLAQHGAERYLYEILKAIDRKKFDCSVLCTYPLTENNNYYEPLIHELGIPLETFQLGELYPNESSNFKRKLKNSLTYRWLNITGNKEKIKGKSENELRKKLEGFDVISILKIEVFNRFPEVFASFDQIIIHLLSWGIQYLENPYENLPARPYRFVTMIDSQKDHVLDTDLTFASKDQMDFFPFPLILDLNGRENTYQTSSDPIRIGVFSRINYDQPTIMFLFAFHLLLKKMPNAELYFYGKAVSEQFQQFYGQTAEVLGIQDALSFRGHVPDLKTSIVDDQITMGWMNIGNSTLGYSSIEISSYGLPVTFFNIDQHDPEKIDDRLFVFNDLEAFVEHSFETLSDSEKLKTQSEKLHDFIRTNHDASINIPRLEQYFIESIQA